MHAAPDWTTHIRRVSRPEDIVVNRDSDMERGESSIEKSGSESPGEINLDSVQKMMSDGQISPTQSGIEEQIKEEEPPDGTEIVVEWKEGHHKIVERRAGSGEEVTF